MIELVISMGIMSVGLVGAMQVFPLGLRASKRTEMISRATILAQRTIEALKLVSDLEEGETVTEEEEFEVTTLVGASQAEGLVDPSRLKMVTVTVRWEQDDRQRAVSFITYVWQNPS